MTINELREKRNQAWNAAKAFASFPKKQCDHAPFSVWNANCSKIHAYLCFHLQRFEFL